MAWFRFSLQISWSLIIPKTLNTLKELLTGRMCNPSHDRPTSASVRPMSLGRCCSELESIEWLCRSFVTPPWGWDIAETGGTWEPKLGIVPSLGGHLESPGKTDCGAEPATCGPNSSSGHRQGRKCTGLWWFCRQPYTMWCFLFRLLYLSPEICSSSTKLPISKLFGNVHSESWPERGT